jgi:hypothetical protein
VRSWMCSPPSFPRQLIVLSSSHPVPIIKVCPPTVVSSWVCHCRHYCCGGSS